jgi:hypothetical protein
MTRKTSIIRTTLLATLGIAAAVSCSLASADPGYDHDHGRAPAPHQHVDARFSHNHAYYDRGYVVNSLPRDRIVINHGPDRFFYSGGVWYAPRGGAFVVVGAPFGVFVPVLPPYYNTVWFGGVPYYYANDTYYMWSAQDNGYEVVGAPPGAANAPADAAPPPPPPAPATSQMFVYPKNGQGPDLQAKDKYECHTWASGQTGFDPTAGGGNVPPDQLGARTDAYNRAITACLQGRGYSVQ